MPNPSYLDRLVTHFESPSFIPDDPVSLCHAFTDRTDQEIIGLYAATLAWGSRAVILSKLEELCTRMQFRPWRFVTQFDPVRDHDVLRTFVHRTFQPEDCLAFTHNLSLLIRQFGSVENIFGCQPEETDARPSIERFSMRMMTVRPDTPIRLQKHLARPSRGSACKRLSLYLRWMVRSGPVDLGLWNSMKPRQLVLPLDIHSGRQARILGLLNRKMNDWKAVIELTDACRKLNRNDPARYDYALFGLGAYGDPFEDS
ncbi:MAG: TIGR02757 family protein [Bacteroidota bacterium]|nr:TIGR02757 family protein [Bacteroidota bacterium]MXW13803.1 TIGR02757 family protein [Rhodothermaceae bacterium]MDE2646052.1 TIGR02757 family protein [Bacteroidota bacterium]MXW33309.1 TIGR02757 family protein [Rhodothermaceae bacterium]MYC03381.1 TIGR02757 family protein [Rhodothermaceae bacterium]